MPTIQQCIARVNTSPGLHTDECHATTEVVSQALSGLAIGPCDTGTYASWKAELARVAQSGECLVYRIDIEQFGNSFAVAQCGGEVLVLQSWVNCYSLHEWMQGTDVKLNRNAFLPIKGAVDHVVLILYLDVLAKDLRASKRDHVHNYALNLFNQTPPQSISLRTTLGYACGKELSFKWASRAIP